MGKNRAIEMLTEHFRKEVREEGRQEGCLQSRRASLLTVLAARFGDIGGGHRDWIEAIGDASQLDTLIAEAVRCADFDSFLREQRP